MEIRYMVYELVTSDEVEAQPLFSFSTEAAAKAFRDRANKTLASQAGPAYVDVFYRPVRGFGGASGDDVETAYRFWLGRNR